MRAQQSVKFAFTRCRRLTYKLNVRSSLKAIFALKMLEFDGNANYLLSAFVSRGEKMKKTCTREGKRLNLECQWQLT